MKTVIEMAREAGVIHIHERPKEFAIVGNDAIERFAEIVRAEERKKWDGQTAVEIHEAVLDEREACAKLCDSGVDTEHPTFKGHIMRDFGASSLLAAAIRARSNT